MNPFNREHRGNLLICLGSLLFLLVVYDSIRPLGFTTWPDCLWKKVRIVPQKGKPGAGLTPVSPQKTPVIPGARITVPCSGEALTTSVVRPGVSYNLWVWAVKPEFKSGPMVNVQIAHPAGGKRGGFSIVAFADADDDGNPDREIARSDYLTVPEAGSWSRFTFKTDEQRIFVGCAWPLGDDILVYRQNGPWPGEDSSLEHIFYFRKNKGIFHSAGPAFTNMRVSFSD